MLVLGLAGSDPTAAAAVVVVIPMDEEAEVDGREESSD